MRLNVVLVSPRPPHTTTHFRPGGVVMFFKCHDLRIRMVHVLRA